MVLKYTFSPSYFVIMDFFSSCNSWPNRFCLIRETLLLYLLSKMSKLQFTHNNFNTFVSKKNLNQIWWFMFRRLASHVNDCTHSWNKTVAKIMTGLFRGWSNGQIGRQGEYFTKEKWTSISAGRFIGSNLMMRRTHTLGRN